MAKFFSFSFFFLILLSATAQNLVPNPSFEEFENGCPANLNEMPVGWTWWLGSPNSFSTCVQPTNWEDSLGWAPTNGFGYQWPASGDAYLGLYGFGNTSNPDYREFAGIELLEPLQVGQIYYASFKVSLAMNGFYYNMMLACSNMGLLFTTSDYDWQNNPLEIPDMSQIYDPEIITDTINWVTISGSFVADQPYTYVGVGVFFSSEYVDTLQIAGEHNAYYYVDDVCVSPNADCSEWAGVGEERHSLRVYPNPAGSKIYIEGINSTADVKIFNGWGQIIFEDHNFMRGSAADVESLSDGVYYIQFDDGRKFKREKLIVCHGSE